MKRYFEMSQDLYVAGRWYLTDPVDGQGNDVGSLLWKGTRFALDEPVRVHFNKFAKRGRSIDYCELDAIGGAVPVVHVTVANVFRELAASDVQLIRADIEGVPDQYYVVNVLRVCKCIDESASRYVEHYTEADAPVFAARIGEYKTVRGLRIDKTRVGDAQVFRTWGWNQSLIVSEAVKDGVARVGTVGIKFEEV